MVEGILGKGLLKQTKKAQAHGVEYYVFKDSVWIVWSHWKAAFCHLWKVVAIWECPWWLENSKSICIQEGFGEWQVSQSTCAPEGYEENSTDFTFLGIWKTSWLGMVSLPGLIFFDQPVCLWGWDDCLDGWGESRVYSDYQTVLDLCIP